MFLLIKLVWELIYLIFNNNNNSHLYSANFHLLSVALYTDNLVQLVSWQLCGRFKKSRRSGKHWRFTVSTNRAEFIFIFKWMVYRLLMVYTIHLILETDFWLGCQKCSQQHH